MDNDLGEIRQILTDLKLPTGSTKIPRVEVAQGEIPPSALAYLYHPMVNLVVSGTKTLRVGTQHYHYSPSHYFVLSLDIPATGVVSPGPDGQAYQAVALRLDSGILSELVHSRTELAEVQDPAEAPAFGVAVAQPEFVNAWLRMVRLLTRPGEVPIFAHLYEQEILLHVILGPQGHLLRALAEPSGAVRQIQSALGRIQHDYREPIDMKALAAAVGMSTSTFHRHFQKVAGISPLQYQKRLRLLAARQTLVTTGRTATEVAYEMGYQSLSQFSREFRQFFGQTPGQRQPKGAVAK